MLNSNPGKSAARPHEPSLLARISSLHRSLRLGALSVGYVSQQEAQDTCPTHFISQLIFTDRPIRFIRQSCTLYAYEGKQSRSPRHRTGFSTLLCRTLCLRLS